MFQTPIRQLEECMEILKRIANSSDKERTELLDRLYRKNNPKDIKKLVEMCELVCYYYDKVSQGKDE